MPQAITTALADMFPDTIIVSGYTGSDGFGAHTYAAGVNCDGYVCAGGDVVRDQGNGEEFATKGKVVFAAVYGLGYNDILVLPADYDDREVVVRRAEPVRDENGPHHDVAYF